MKIWLSLPFFPLGDLPELVVGAERIGVEGVTVSDHICVPVEINSTYPYTGQPAVLPVGTEFPDPLTAIAYLAGKTAAIRFMSHVMVGPVRHPVVLAKEAATTAALTGNRVDLGLGVGWLAEEYESVGVDFAERGRCLDAMIDLMRALWTGKPVASDGPSYRFAAITQHPVPTLPVPVIIGGESRVALRRAAERGDGWAAVTPRVDDLNELLKELRLARKAAGTLKRPFILRSGVKGTLTSELIEKVAATGIDALIVTPHQLVPHGASPYDVELAEILARLAVIVDHSRAL